LSQSTSVPFIQIFGVVVIGMISSVLMNYVNTELLSKLPFLVGHSGTNFIAHLAS
jgi:hypothetical protein